MTCEVCNGAFYSSHAGINCCQKHYNIAYRTGSPYSPEGKQNTNTFYDREDYIVGKTRAGVKYYFDKEDYPLVSKHSWCTCNGYLVATIKRKFTKLHRYILNAAHGTIIDHINGNPLDNRRLNLRITSQKNNSRNTSLSKSNKLKHLGVSACPGGKYRARIMVDNKEINLGHFINIKDAISARRKAEIKYFKEYAPSLRKP